MLLETRQSGDEIVYAFDTDGDQRADFWQYAAVDGRVHAIACVAADGASPGPRIELDAIAASTCPHFIIVLDGVPFEVVEELYRAGHFRLFHPPARVVCCFPAMTDLALSELFHTERCLAYQARYYDPDANRVVDGTDVYLSGRNAPWVGLMSYRCSFWWDVLAYLNPGTVFAHELRGMLRAFHKVEEGEAYAYSVGTAGLGTRGGRPAIEAYLRTVDQLCQRIVFERRGQVKITLTADHGHNLVETRRVSFRKLLTDGGYRVTRSLREPRDIVPIAYGLVTYAAFFTADPAGAAECLLGHEDVEFACYPEADAVIVRDRDGRARITKGEDGFVYESDTGDPLGIAPTIERLWAAGNVSHAGEIDEAALFAATVDHKYPDPLARIWGAFHDLVEYPPDLIVNLRDGACHGSKFFHTMIRRVSSTHGSLDARNSTTFVMTMLGEPPPVLRTRDVLPALESLRGRGGGTE